MLSPMVPFAMSFCGNGIATYVTHGIMLGLLVLAIPFALKVASEKREKTLHAVTRNEKFVIEKDRVAPYPTGPIYPGTTYPATTYPATTGYSAGGPMMGVPSTTTTGIAPQPMMMGTRY